MPPSLTAFSDSHVGCLSNDFLSAIIY